ncbi:type IV secretion system protein [Bartonella gabonensis]|uniref:type IV secretion system protein n=1 Tax=Bartonella gabonensis TaxID=2699889 RepID=UPI0015894295|nr:type IV secretion system protein [Bartonella gabonensis]
MKKQVIITGIITLLGSLSLTLADANSKKPDDHSVVNPNDPSTLSPEEKKSEIIKLLKRQIKESKTQFQKTEEIYQSITGNKIQDKIKKNPNHHFFYDPALNYPSPHKTYMGLTPRQFKNMPYLESLMTQTNIEEHRIMFSYMKSDEMRNIINKRLEYSGIIAKAVSLQTLLDADKRFTQIVDLLNDINKTEDLKDIFELQASIRHMSAMIQNEYAKLQMVINLSDNQEPFIDIQKRKLHQKIFDVSNKNVPHLRFQ